jgi:ABC-2 type transport system ATP-binding protein
VKQVTQAQLLQECKQALSVIVDNADKAASVLKDTLGIDEIMQISANELRLYGYLDKPDEVTYQLNKHGVRVSGLTPVGDTLEEYYTKVVRSADND